MDLSRVFFLYLEMSCKGFVELFSGVENPVPISKKTTNYGSKRDVTNSMLPIPVDILAHLLTWLQNQISVFATVLSRQVFY